MFIVYKRIQGYLLKTISPLRSQRWFSDHQNDTMLPSLLLLVYGHGTTDWLQIGQGVCQGCILSPCLFNLYAEYIMRNAGLEETEARIRLPGEISITSDMQMIPPLWQKVKRNSKPLDESESGE